LLSALCGHPRHCSTTPGAVATPGAVGTYRDKTSLRRPLCHAWLPPVAPSNPFLVTTQGQTMTPGRRQHHPRRCQPRAVVPATAVPRARTATTTPTLLSTRGRDAVTPATVPHTGHCQRPPRALSEPLQSTTTPLPSKSLLFGHRTRHDAATGARFARAAINSTALFVIPQHV
jgi:hypothetical protein